MRLSVQLYGTSPLVMHNIRLANPQDEHSKAIKQLTKKKAKTEDDAAEIERLEWYGGLYYEKQFGGVYVPTWNILRCFEEAAKVSRDGKTVMRSVVVTDMTAPISYDGPSDIDALWEDKRFRWSTVIGIQKQSKLVRMRPIFRDWSCEIQVEVLTDMLDRDQFERIVQRAGLIEGLGDARKLGYGRFDGKVLDA